MCCFPILYIFWNPSTPSPQKKKNYTHTPIRFSDIDKVKLWQDMMQHIQAEGGTNGGMSIISTLDLPAVVSL